MTTDKLMKKFINGDKSVFEEIYSRTRKSVYYVVLSVLRERALAEDAMQSAYLSVLKNADKYTVGTNADAWIVRIAKNQALNMKKARGREQSTDESENPALFGTQITDDYGLLVDLAKKILPEDEFVVLMLITSSDYKRREISRMLDMPISTVTWKYENALAKMRNELSDKKGV